MDRDKLKNKIIDDICNFGDGKLEFETRDIEALINWIDELRGRIKNLSLGNVRLSLPSDEKIEMKAEFRQKPRNPKNNPEEEFIHGFIQGADWIIDILSNNEA